jgi:hypothetical protein
MKSAITLIHKQAITDGLNRLRIAKETKSSIGVAAELVRF